MAPIVDSAMGCLQGSENTPLTPSLGDNVQGSVQYALRSRSDSLDIFTMSPLGTPPFDACSSSQDAPSTPQLRLPDPPALDLDPGLIKTNSAVPDVHHRPRSPPSTPNSPTSFSFSPPRGMEYQPHGTSYPFGSQCGSQYGGTSYSTDITSPAGSWDNHEVYSKHLLETVSTREVKGKHVVREVSPSVLGPSPSKGKGKAVHTPLIPPSPSHASFEFDFDFQHAQDFDLDLSGDGDGDRDVSDHDAAESPVVRLSPGTHYRQFGQSTEDYAGPSSRNGHFETPSADDREDVHSNLEPRSSPDDRTLSASSLHPIPSTGPALHPSHPMNEIPPRLPMHRRSFSSTSLRSIRSSSSRSIASIRSTFTGVGIRGKVRSIAPAAKKLKGGLRKMFKRNPSGSSVEAVGFTLSDDGGESGDEEEPPRLAVEEARANREPSDPHESEPEPVSDPNQKGHILEASTDSQATVQLALSGVVHLSENVAGDTMPTVLAKPRTMSEPTLFDHANEPKPIQKHEAHPQTSPQHTEEVQQAHIEVAVVVQPNYFNDTLPRELQLTVLKALVSIHEEEHERAERGEAQDRVWSVRAAEKTRWVGRDKGLRELVKLTRVSKMWHSLAFDGQLWHTLCFASSPPHLSLSLLLKLADHAGSFVQSLDLRGWAHLDPVTLRVLVRSLSSVPASEIFLKSQGFPVLAVAGPFPPTNLTRISLRTCTSLTTHSLHHVLLRAPSLRSINLHGLSAVTNTTCSVLSAYCPKLEIADLGRCANLDGDGLRELVGGGVLARTWTSEEGSSPITPPDVFNVPLGYLDSKLRVLRAPGLKRLREDILAALGKHAPHLEVLDLSGSPDLTDGAVEAFIMWDDAWDMTSCDAPSRCKVELTARDVGRDPITDSGPFFKRITRLRHLNLSSCLLLTDAACTHMAHCVPQLEFLELAGIGQELRDDGLVRLLRTTPLLRRLDLEDACGITDTVLEALTVKPPAEMRRRGVTVTPPLSPGHNLEHLVLSYALSITNDALLTLIRECQRLTILECDNTRISGTVLKEFVKLARQRRLHGAGIVAVDCRAISEALVKELAGLGQTRTRMGYRHYEARLLGYVDARDEENLGATGILGGQDVDDCDDTRVAIKSFWSWQAVDAVRQAREKRRKLALSARRNTDAGVLGEAFGRNGILNEDDEDLLGLSGPGPSSRPRWLAHWTRASGSGASSPTGIPSMNDDERGCVLM